MLSAAAILAAVLLPSQSNPDDPQGAVVLFDGKDTSAWVHRNSREPFAWKVENGDMVVTAGKPDIMTRQEFGDYRLHVEFCLPLMPEAKDQGRANSGVYNQGRYEIQILDNWNNSTYATGGIGAIYGQKDPDKDAIVPPGWWNTYDILFRSARLGPDGKVVEKPRITVWHNGIKIHNNVEIEKSTTAGIEGPWVTKGPILLQNHGNPVRFRNIWIVPMDGKL